MKELFTRRSVREFSQKEISSTDLDLILKAASQAPSAHNQQPWEFILCVDKKNLEMLSHTPGHSDFLREANKAIILIARPQDTLSVSDMMIQDMALAAQNIMLEARHLGIGSCYIGIYPRSDRMNYLSENLNIPSNYTPFCIIALGYPKNEGAFFEKKREYQSRMHKEKF